MEKSKFEKFINKYNLGGVCESVIFKSSNNALSVRAIANDKNVLAEVTVDNIKFPNGEFSVYDTKKLRSILNVLEENLSIKPNKADGNITGLDISDDSTKATFVLADQSVIPQVPEIKKVPPIELTISLDEKFVNTFIKAKNALPEIETFTVLSDGNEKTASVVIGYSTLNTNRIHITGTTDVAAKLEPTSFSANYFREILTANKDAKNGTLKVSSKGMAVVTFTIDDFSSTYYLVKITA